MVKKFLQTRLGRPTASWYKHYRHRPVSPLHRRLKRSALIFGVCLILESALLQIASSYDYSQLTTTTVPVTKTVGSVNPNPTPTPTQSPSTFIPHVLAATQPTPPPTPTPIPPQVFKSPLRTYTLTQRFSSYHLAIDMAARSGTPIYASTQGTVLATGYLLQGGGLMVKIAHRDGYVTYYAHLSSITTKKGATVDNSTQIGRVGQTGWATGPHLHFMVEQNGRLVNPLAIIK